MRLNRFDLTFVISVFVIIVGLAFMVIRANHFEAHCHDLGGTSRMLGGRDQHMLCISPDGRLLDER